MELEDQFRDLQTGCGPTIWLDVPAQLNMNGDLRHLCA